MKIGIIGSGDVAQSLGTAFVSLGHEVKISSRTPGSATIAEWTKRVGARGSGGSFSEAAEFGEWVVIASRGVENEAIIRAAGPAHFEGKVVIDVTNPLAYEPNAPPKLAYGFNDSAGERVQKALPRSHVVKAFNIVGHVHMFRPQFPGGPPDMFFCGNDDGAKQKVAGLLTEFGWHPIDIGGIEGARLLESLCILWVVAGIHMGSWDIAFKLLQKPPAPGSGRS